MNWPAIFLRIKANEVIADDRRARGDIAGARQLEAWNRGFVHACEIFCNRPTGYYEVAA